MKATKDKSVKSVKSSAVKKGPGRPRYSPVFPRTKSFTFSTFLALNQERDTKANESRADGAKAIKPVTPLTLRKWLARDKSRKVKSQVIKLKDELAPPSGADGLGRKQFLYSLRPGSDAPATAATAPKTKGNKLAKAKDSTVAVPLDTPADAPAQVDAVSPETVNYEATKAALLAPVVNVPTPEPATAPEPAAVATVETPATDAVAVS